MARKVLKVGILSKDDYKRRTIAIAKGEYVPGKGEPKVWFESIQSLAQILSCQNQELLRIIEEQEPSSLQALEELTGRKTSNLSRTLRTLETYGIVELRRAERAIRPMVKATDFEVEFGLNSPWVVPREKEGQRPGMVR